LVVVRMVKNPTIQHSSCLKIIQFNFLLHHDSTTLVFILIILAYSKVIIKFSK
jgi:hypothetical protein